MANHPKIDGALAHISNALEDLTSSPDQRPVPLLREAMELLREVQAEPEADATFDLVAHLHRQRAFSERTFGPGARTAGVLDHIRKELAEVEAAPEDVTEWVDLVILALDGAWRAGHQPQAIVDALVAKQERNEGRTWPDWRTADPSKAIEHDRSGEPTEADHAAVLASIPMPVEPGAEPSPPLEVIPPLRPDSTPEEVTAHFNAVDAARAAHNDEAMVDASDDPAAMNAALIELAKALGADCELDDMLHAIDKLQRDAEDVDGLRDQLEQVRARATEGLRLLWLVVREASGPDGITIPMRSMAATDWSTCALRRDDDLATGGLHLVAVSRGEAVSRRRTQHQAMHQQLLDMLGATDHQGAAGRIGELVALELLLNAGGAGKGVTAIAQERRGQIEREGYAPSEDDGYTAGELVQAAVAYATWEWSEADDREGHLAVHWPASWNPAAFKPRDYRANLVRSGALIAAELDRLDRKDASHG